MLFACCALLSRERGVACAVANLKTMVGVEVHACKLYMLRVPSPVMHTCRSETNE